MTELDSILYAYPQKLTKTLFFADENSRFAYIVCGNGDLMTKNRRFWLILNGCLLLVFFVWWFVPWVPRLNHGPATVARWDRHKGAIVRAKVGPTEKGWIPIKSVSKHVLNAFIAAEDSRFYQHSGFDFEQIWLSMKINYRHKRYARGGSTISQQVVKMAFLTREKTVVRKIREAIGTVWLELWFSKPRILEWYINLAEFGDGVYGIKDASWHYFKTKPELLTIENGVHLALVLPNPNLWSAGLRKQSLTPFGHKRFMQIVTNMRLRGSITEVQWKNALATGDFGRPIAGSESIISGETSKESVAEPDFTDQPEVMPVSPQDGEDAKSEEFPPPSEEEETL